MFFMVANFISIVSESEHISRQRTALSFHARSAFHFGGYDMTDNILVDLSMDFSVEIVNMCDTIKGKSALTNQILRSGTSIGANVAEAEQAQSTADFISKMSISLKEVAETKYWLRLLKETKFISQKEFDSIFNDCVELEKILVSIIKSSK